MSRTFKFNAFDTGIGRARLGLPASVWDDDQQIAVSGAFVHGDRTTRAEILPANDPVVENGTSGMTR